MSREMPARLASLVLVVGFLSCASAAGATIPVGPSEGLKKIQEGIDAASDGDTVLVKPGAYNEGIDFKGKKIQVMSENGPAATTIDAAGLPRTSVAIFRTAETAESVLEGFTLTGGTGAVIGTGTVQLGGGIHIDRAAPTVRNCIVRNNVAVRGGGILVIGAGAGGLIEKCEVRENRASTPSGPAGGGISVELSGTTPDTLTLIECNLTKNTVTGGAQGGGAYLGRANTKAKVVVKKCVASENLVGTQAAPTGEGGGFFLDTVLVEMEDCDAISNQALKGGGMMLRNLGPTSFVKDSRVVGNKAPGSGGGGGFCSPAGSTARCLLSGVEIQGNEAGTLGGGGLLLESGNPNLEACRFIGNSTTVAGGAIRSLATGSFAAKVNATVFLNNSGGGQGGAIYVSSSSAQKIVYSNCIFAGNRSTGEGGAIYNRAPSAAAIVKFFYCTFYKNIAAAGSSAFHFDAGQAQLRNCILWDNSPLDYPLANQNVIFSSAVKTPTFPPAKTDIFPLDPEFVAPDNDPPDFHLKDTSPLIDKGSAIVDPDFVAVTTDLEGKPRHADGPDPDSTEAPDLGPYEIVLGPVVRPSFVRGFCRHPAATLEGAQLQIGDALYLLRYRFVGALGYPEPGCLKGCDADDNGNVDLSDAMYILRYLFQGSNQAPKAPFPARGEDPTPDSLGCPVGLPPG